MASEAGGGSLAVLPEIDAAAPVRAAAAALAAATAKIRDRAVTIRTGWQALGGVYRAPEQGLVLAAMNKPAEAATTLADHTTKVKNALDVYADRLEELARQRQQLMTDIASYESARAAFLAEPPSLLGDFGATERDLMGQGQAIQGRISAWQQACDEAQLECANAIRGLLGAAPLKLSDRATVEETEAGLAAGLSAKAYDALARSGQAPWDPPEIWNGWTFWGKQNALVQGGGDFVVDTWDLGKTVVTGGEHGERRVMASHLRQTGRDVATLYAAGAASESMLYGGPTPVGPSDAEVQAASERLHQVGKAAIGWDNWGTSGWRQAGSFLPDVALSFVGGAGVARAGAAGTVRGALSRSLMRVAPSTAIKAEKLAGAVAAVRTMQRMPDVLLDTRVAKNVLTTSRNTAYRIKDTATAARVSVRTAAADAVDATAHAARTAASPLLPHLQPQYAMATAGARRVTLRAEQISQRTRLGTMLRTSPGDVPAGQPPRFTSRADAPLTGAAKRVEYAGDPVTGMRGHPPVKADLKPPVSIDTRGTFSELMPKARETFGENLMERARAAYGIDSPQVEALRNARLEVRGRGTFFTDDTGRVVFVEPMRRQFTTSWKPLARPLMSTDLRNPLPETTYLVDNRTFFHTDANGWTDHVHITAMPEEKAPRGWAAQRNVSAGHPGIDAGHLHAHARGGTGEEINLVKMVQGFNRGTGGRSVAHGNNWAELERLLQSRFDQNDISAVDLYVDYNRDPVTPSTWKPGQALSEKSRLAPPPKEIRIIQYDQQGSPFKSLRMINE